MSSLGNTTSLSVVSKEQKSKNTEEKELQYNQTNYLGLYKVHAGKNGEIKALITDDRGTITLEEKAGKLIPVKNTAVKVFPKKLMNGETTTYIQLEVKAGKKEKLVTCQLASLSNLGRRSDDLKGYTDAGGTMNKAFGEKLYDIVISAGGAGLIDEVQGYEEAGWNSEEQHVRPGDDLYIGNLPISTEKSGDFETWKNAVNELLEANGTVQATLPLCFAVGGYLMGLSGFTIEYSPIYNLFSDDSSVGKSTLQKIIQSIQKDPANLFNAISTRVGAEFSLASNNDGFLCIEELHGMTRGERQPVGRLMYLAEGGNRQKGTKGGGLAKALKWHSMLIASANLSLNSLAEGDEQKEALAARIIENNCVTSPLFSGENIGLNIKNCNSVINENYGYAYPKIISFITENIDSLRGAFAAFEKHSRNCVDSVNGIVERKISACALAMCGGIILEKLGVKINNNYDTELLNIIIEASSIHVQEEIEKERSVRDDMLTLFNTLLGSTRVDGYLAKNVDDCAGHIKKIDGVEFNVTTEEQQKERAEDHNRNVKEVYAVLEQNEVMEQPMNATGTLFVSSSKGSKDFILRKTGISLDSLARRADLSNQLHVQESARKKNMLTNVKKGQGRGYAFYMCDFGLDPED